LNSSETSALETLEKLRLTRADENPFASNVDFYRWADDVAGALLACDIQAYRRFHHRVQAVQSAYAFNIDPLDSINNAIGCVNESLFALKHQASIAKQTQDPRDFVSCNPFMQNVAAITTDQSAPPVEASKHIREFTKQVRKGILFIIGAAATAVVGALVGKFF
jgi:hypothetical protein